MPDKFWSQIRNCLVYFCLSFFLILGQLLPLELLPSRWPWPDLVLLLGIAWGIHTKHAIPFGVTILVFLLNDLLTEVPLGISALLSVCAIEWLKWRRHDIRQMPVLLIWSIVGLVFAFIYLGKLFLLLLIMGEFLFWEIMLRQSIVNIAFYPVFAILFRLFQTQRSTKQKDKKAPV